MNRNSINTGQRLSPSARKIIKLRERAFNSGGASLELQIPTNYIRDISRDFNDDVTKDVARRNLVRWSEEFGNTTAWNSGGATATSNVVANPIDGAITADLYDDTNASLSPGVPTQSGIIATSTIVTYSIYTKKVNLPTDGTRRFLLRNQTTSTSFTALSFPYVAGIYGGGWVVEDVGDGWFRLKYTQTTGINIGDILTIYVGRTGSAISGATDTWYLYGAQLEAGTVATHYQQTQTSNTDTGASLIMSANTIGESRLFNCKPELRNLLVNSATGTTQNVSVKAQAYTLQLKGTGTYTLSGAFSGSLVGTGVSNLVTLTFTPTAGTLTLTVSGSITEVQLEVGSTATTYQRTTDGIIDFQATRATSANVVQKDGTIGDSCFNLFLNTETLSTQSLTLSNIPYNVSFYGTGTITFSGAYSGSLIGSGTSNRVSLSFTPSAGSVTFTVTGSVTKAQISQGSSLKDYLKTTNRLNVPSIDYSLGSDKPALLVEPQRTNLVFPSATATTQSRTVTAVAHTLSFYGTGTVTLSGVATGSLVGTGANNKVTLTFTPTAGSLTLTVTGSVTNWQLETGSNATSLITTTTASATRNAYTSYVDLFNDNMLNKDNFTLYVEGYLQDGTTTNASIVLSDTTGTGARANDLGLFDGMKATYAVGGAITSDTVALSNNNYFKIAITRSGTSVKWFRNGAQIWTTQVIAVFDYRYLVVNHGGSTYAIQKIALWKHTKTDDECITMTS